MPLLSTLAGLTGALTLAASPLAAAAPPVSVVACDYNSLSGTGANLIEATAPFQTSSLRITFVNQAALPATNVRFAVRYSDRTQTIDDHGIFSTGTPITHDYTPAVNSPYEGAAQCIVEAVTFSDGSTWQPV